MKLIFENWRRYQQEALNEAEDLPRVKTRARMRDAAPGTPEREYQDLMRAGPTVPRPSDVAYRKEADKIKRIKRYDPKGAEIKAREKGTLAQMRKAYEEEVPLTMQLLGGLLGVTDIPDAMIAYDEFTDVLARYEEDQKGDPEDTLQHATERPRGASMSNLHMEANTNKGAPTTMVDVGFAASIFVLALLAVIPLAGKGFKAFKAVLRRVSPQLTNAFKYAKGWAQHQRRSPEAREAIEKAVYEIGVARKQSQVHRQTQGLVTSPAGASAVARQKAARARAGSAAAKFAKAKASDFEVISSFKLPSLGYETPRTVVIVDTLLGPRAFYESAGTSMKGVDRVDQAGKLYKGPGPKFLETSGVTIDASTVAGELGVDGYHISKIGKEHPDVGKYVSADGSGLGKYPEPGSITDQIGHSLENTSLPSPVSIFDMAEVVGLSKIADGNLAAVNKDLFKNGYLKIDADYIRLLIANEYLAKHGINIADVSSKWSRLDDGLVPGLDRFAPGDERKVPGIKDLAAAMKQTG
jgi:hypothetical protein